jgi:tetratricopeptide (TPR) repeat protein
MLSHWKKILFLAIVVAVVYAGCNTQGILRTEKMFREDNPKLALSPRICYTLGTIAHWTFRYQLAIDIIDRNLRDYPYDPAAEDAQYRRAVAYEKLGQYDKAIQLYEAFLIDHPKSKRQESILNKVTKLKALHQQQP